jgi:hypothetical protein
MPSSNVERIRRGHEALELGDLEPSAATLAPNATWHAWEPGPWDCTNREQILGTLKDRVDRGLIGPIKELVELDENRVLLLMKIPADSPATREMLGIESDQDEIANVITLRGGQIVSMRDYRSKADALRS